MLKIRFISLVIITSILFSSCASILNGKYQKVDIYTDPETELLVNGEEPRMKKGKVMLQRDHKPKQITIKKEDHKDFNHTVMPYKKSFLYVFSVVPFGILLYPMIYDVGPKAFNYDSEFNLKGKQVSLPEKSELAKNIHLQKLSVNIESDELKYRYFRKYKQFVKRGDKKDLESSEDMDKIEVENTIFSSMMNQLLKEKGYIDTSNRALKNSYLNNLVIEADLKGYQMHIVNSYLISSYGGMIYADLKMNWKVLDYYGGEVYNLTTETTSDKFAYQDSEGQSDAIESSIKDAIEYGLIQFMKDEKINELMHDKSVAEEEAAFEEIKLNSSAEYVSNLSEAIKSSVTIKTNNGHGSGFLISSDGHIITNYHVIADTSGLEVVTNDKKTYDASIIRSSKIYDLALIKIEGEKFKPFKLSSNEDIEIAKDIYAVGTPKAEDLSQTISKGIISGIREKGNDSKVIQTDASINSGNSGGAIVGKDGVVIGVVSAKLMGFGVEGVAFGIPAYEINNRLNINFQ